jgi:hypothetical protein
MFTAYPISDENSEFKDLGELINFIFFKELKSFYKNEKKYKNSYFTINKKSIKWFGSFKNAYSSIPIESNSVITYLSGSFGAIIGFKNDDYFNPNLFIISDETGYHLPYIIKPNLKQFYKLLKSTTLIIRANQQFFTFTEDEENKNIKYLNREDNLFDKRSGKLIDPDDIDSLYENDRFNFKAALNFIRGGYQSKQNCLSPKIPYQLDSYLNFGKYKLLNAPNLVNDLKLIDIIEQDISYFNWILINLNHFFLEKDQIEKFKNKISKKALLINARKVNEYTAITNDYYNSGGYESNSNNDREYAERESFYAMTDGNYGSYDECYGID